MAWSEEWRRVESLLSPERLGFSLAPAAPELNAESVGALAVKCWRSAAPEVRVSAFLFEGFGDGNAAAGRLRELVDGGPLYARTAVNGSLMCFAVTEAPGRPGRSRVNSVVSAFSGDRLPGS